MTIFIIAEKEKILALRCAPMEALASARAKRYQRAMRRFLLFSLVIAIAASLFAMTLWLGERLWNEYDAFQQAQPSDPAPTLPEPSSPARVTPPPTVTVPSLDEPAEDPAILLTLRRWEYCRARFTDESTAHTCARELAQRDFQCLREPTPAAQRACVLRLYP